MVATREEVYKYFKKTTYPYMTELPLNRDIYLILILFLKILILINFVLDRVLRINKLADYFSDLNILTNFKYYCIRNSETIPCPNHFENNENITRSDSAKNGETASRPNCIEND